MMTMDANKLWAKSKAKNEEERESMFLHKHLEDVYESACRVLDATAVDQLKALGLPVADYLERFKRCVKLAAACHDLGKANDHFQGMITGKRDVRTNPQGVRHEWISVLMLESMRDWLLPAVHGSEADFAIVEWAIGGHHPAYDRESPPRRCPPGAGNTLKPGTDHPQFAEILEWLRTIFSLAKEKPALPTAEWKLTGSSNVYAEFKEWRRKGTQRFETMAQDEQGFVAAIKDCLVAADIAGSAIPKTTATFDWIIDSFEALPTQNDLTTIVEVRKKSFQDYDAAREAFQTRVEQSKASVTYVKAGCGSGKTQAAYMWAANNYPTRRLFFCYPTTGTATEGYRDYLHEPNIDSTLFHSRRLIDLEAISNTCEAGKNSEQEELMKLDALDSWATPIVSCTVDTVLGIVQNNKRGLFAWPALAQSAFVFDEIHAYDDRLFGALLRFLQDLPGLPALLMTASLPEPREYALKEVLADRERELNCITGPASLETRPRYHKQSVPNNDPLELVKATLESGKKVLWVCNIVGRVMQFADMASQLKPKIYHSRFRYMDRVKRHTEVINAFKPDRPGPALAICSQVAEMSLDLSADLLVTDLATVPAMIQRMGRLNRYAKEGDATKPFVVIEPDNCKPYSSNEQTDGQAWLERLLDKEISQFNLSTAWLAVEADSQIDYREFMNSKWLDGGPLTEVTNLRGEGYTIAILMEEDLAAARSNNSTRLQLTLPMPIPNHLDWQKWKFYKGMPIAPKGTIDYSEARGASWSA